MKLSRLNISDELVAKLAIYLVFVKSLLATYRKHASVGILLQTFVSHLILQQANERDAETNLCKVPRNAQIIFVINKYLGNLKSKIFAVPHSLIGLFIAIFFAGYLISLRSNWLFADQLTLIEGSLDLSNYPQFTSGIFSHILIYLYVTFVRPIPELINFNIVRFSMILFFVSTYLFSRKILKNEWLLWLFVLLLFASKFPFIWLSSELFAGSFLSIIFYGILSSWHPAILGILMAVASYIKPDLPFLMIILLIYCIYKYRDKKKSLHIVSSYFAVFVIFIVPGIFQQGLSFFSDNRSFMSFAQHYSALVFPHQLDYRNMDPFTPWQEWETFAKSAFPGSDTIFEVIYNYPRRYLDFFVLSFAHGLVNIISIFKFLVVFILGRILFTLRNPALLNIFSNHREFERLFLLSLTGLIPSFIMSYVHIRYLTKYYPLLLILILAYIQSLIYSGGKKSESRIYILLGVGLLLILFAMQAKTVYFNWIFLTPKMIFWFPD